MRIRVLLVDDEALMREALSDLIASDPSLELVGSAADAGQAIELAGLHRPDVALLDVKIPGGGAYAAGRIAQCSPGTRIIALTAYADRTTVMTMIGAGAQGYLVKGSSAQTILHAVHESMLGHGVLSPEAAAEVFPRLTAGVDPEESVPADVPPEDSEVSASAPIRVMLVDDHKMLMESMLNVLVNEPDLEVVGAATSVAEAISVARGCRPHVVLMDYRLPDGTGTEATRLIRQENPEIKVVMLTGFPDDALMVSAIEVGCCGFLPKNGPVQEVLATVRAAHAGEAAIQPSTLIRLIPRLRRDYAGVAASLTERELQVLRLLIHGSHNQVVAERLRLSVHTVRNHVQSILAKLGAHSKLEAVAKAVRFGIIDMGDVQPQDR